MHESHIHLNHFQTVEKIVFLIVKKGVFYLNLVTNGHIRHVVFRRTWRILLYRRGDTICKMIIYLFLNIFQGVENNIIFKFPLLTLNSIVAA